MNYILKLGKCYNIESFLNDDFSDFGNDEWQNNRLKLFDELDEYYKIKYNGYK